MTRQDWHKSLLALVMWREARGEGIVGMRAVGCVIRNRVLATHLPDQWDDIIERKWQFSSLTAPGDSQLVAWPRDDDPFFIDAMKLSEDIYTGVSLDSTAGAVFYANLAVVPETSSFWKIVKDTVNHPQTAKIGNHTFFA